MSAGPNETPMGVANRLIDGFLAGLAPSELAYVQRKASALYAKLSGETVRTSGASALVRSVYEAGPMPNEIALAAEGKGVHVIQSIRSRTNLSLSESKRDVYDRWLAEGKIKLPTDAELAARRKLASLPEKDRQAVIAAQQWASET